MRRFRSLTLGKPVIMGSKTFESIGKPLPERDNIVLTRNASYKVPSSCNAAHSIEESIFIARKSPLYSGEIMIIGGASVYKQFLPMAHRMYLTKIYHEFKGDVHFPEFNEEEWEEKERINHAPNKENLYRYSFLTLERRLSKKES